MSWSTAPPTSSNPWPSISKAPQGQDGPSLKQAPIGDDAPEGRRHIGEDHLGGREHGHTTQGQAQVTLPAGAWKRGRNMQKSEVLFHGSPFVSRMKEAPTI